MREGAGQKLSRFSLAFHSSASEAVQGACQPAYRDLCSTRSAAFSQPTKTTNQKKPWAPLLVSPIVYPGNGNSSFNDTSKQRRTGPGPQSSRMWHILRRRHRDSIDQIIETLITMAVDARLMPSSAPNTPENHLVRSTASTPSLRSRDGTLPMLARMDGGGNVRVVVRVRAFLQRGIYFTAGLEAVLLLSRMCNLTTAQSSTGEHDA